MAINTQIDLGVQSQDGSLLNTKIKDGEITGAKINASAAIAISKLNTTSSDFDSSGTLKTSVVANANVASGAAISLAKINTTGADFDSNGTLRASVVSNANVAAGAAVAYSKLALSNSIVDADVASGAAIATTKLADSSNFVMRGGSVAFTGNQSMGTHKLTNLGNGSDPQDAVTKSQLDGVTGLVNNFEWQPSVLSAILLTPPVSPAIGDRYLIDGVGAGNWFGKDLQIAQWNGSAWTYITASIGTFVSSDAEPTKIYLFSGASWDSKYFESTTASTGLTKVGFDIRLDASSAGFGLGFSSGVLAVGGGNGIVVSADGIAVDAGTAANKIVQLDANAKLPTIDGSALTNLNASNIASGTLNASQLPNDGYSSTYVHKSGDTMTGNLVIGGGSGGLSAQVSAAGLPAGEGGYAYAMDSSQNVWVTDPRSNLAQGVLYKIVNGNLSATYQVADLGLIGMRDVICVGTNLWIIDTDFGVYKVDISSGAPGTVTPFQLGMQPRSIAYSGTNIWVIGVNGSNGSLSGFPPTIANPGQIPFSEYLPLNNPVKIIWDGGFLWCLDGDGHVSKMDEALNTLASVGLPHPVQTGTSNGTYVWATSSVDGRVSKVTMSSGSVATTTLPHHAQACTVVNVNSTPTFVGVGSDTNNTELYASFMDVASNSVLGSVDTTVMGSVANCSGGGGGIGFFTYGLAQNYFVNITNIQQQSGGSITLATSGKITTQNLQITGGSISNGSLLVSDNNGNGSWVSTSMVSVGNASTLNSLSSGSFLRSDSSSSLSTGNALTISGGAILNLNGTTNINGTTLTSTATELNLLHSSGVSNQELADLGTIIIREVPATAPDGITTDFTLAHAPLTANGSTCEEVYLNGILQDVGSGNDYTLVSGNIVRFTFAPIATDKIRVSYRY